MRHLFRSLILFLFLGVIFYGSAMTDTGLSVVGDLKSAFALPILTLRYFFSVKNFAERVTALERENMDLRAELFISSLNLVATPRGFLRAKVFAVFPFNSKSLLSINVGLHDGVKEGFAVLVGGSIFLGQIVKVDEKWSEVRTVFDGSRELPVRVGAKGVPALLKGGTGLTAAMIDRLKEISQGDVVYTASRDLPYGLKIGEVKKVLDSSGSAFKEAEIAPPYSLADLDEVLVLLK